MNACMCICTINVVAVCNFTYLNFSLIRKNVVAFDQRGSDNRGFTVDLATPKFSSHLNPSALSEKKVLPSYTACRTSNHLP